MNLVSGYLVLSVASHKPTPVERTTPSKANKSDSGNNGEILTPNPKHATNNSAHITRKSISATPAELRTTVRRGK